jgi:hypothetical protein
MKITLNRAEILELIKAHIRLQGFEPVGPMNLTTDCTVTCEVKKKASSSGYFDR